MTETIDLTDLDAALATAAPELDRTARHVAVATYRSLAAGGPASPGTIAVAAGVDPATVDQLLDQWGAVFRDDRGDVIGFWGLAVADMPHRLRIGDRQLYAWCAWDPLFLARIVGPLAVATDDPESGEEITYRLDEHGAIHDLSHPRSVLSFLRPGREWDDEVMATFCHYVLHFTEPAAAERWASRHDGTLRARTRRRCRAGPPPHRPHIRTRPNGPHLAAVSRPRDRSDRGRVGLRTAGPAALRPRLPSSPRRSPRCPRGATPSP